MGYVGMVSEPRGARRAGTACLPAASGGQQRERHMQIEWGRGKRLGREEVVNGPPDSTCAADVKV